MLTGKLPEYLGAERPILALVPEGPARDVLSRCGAAEIADSDDVEGAAYFFVTEGLTNVLKHAEATKVALITLITPVSALLLGNLLSLGRNAPGQEHKHGQAQRASQPPASARAMRWSLRAGRASWESLARAWA